MEKIISDLENLKRTLPGSCSFHNLHKLQLAWRELNNILSRFPKHYIRQNRNDTVVLERLQVKMETIYDNGGSSPGARSAFMEAIEQFRNGIDTIIANAEAESIPQPDHLTNEP